MKALILQCRETEDLGLRKSCFRICCGAQLLAIELGGEARASPVVEIGLTELNLTRAGSADLLVVGDASRKQMFRKGRAVGVMFHLEVSAEAAKRAEETVAECRVREGEMREIGRRLVLDSFF